MRILSGVQRLPDRMREAVVQSGLARRVGQVWEQHRDCICDIAGAVTLFATFIIILYILHGFGLSGLE